MNEVLIKSSREIEEAVLGAMMLERDALDTGLELLDENCFFYPENQLLFRAIKDISLSGGGVDLLTVTAKIRRMGKTEMLSAYDITRIASAVVSGAHIEQHSRMLREYFIERELLNASSKITKRVSDGVDPLENLDISQGELSRIAMTSIKSDFVHAGDVAYEVHMEIEHKRVNGIETGGVETPFDGITQLTGGWQKTDLIIIAARPGVGKTAFSLECAKKAMNEGVGIFSLEMGKEQLIKRLKSNISNIYLEKLNKPTKLTEFDSNELIKSANTLKKSKIFIDDQAGLTILELRAKARKLVKKHGVKMLIVDYLQLMNGREGLKSINREQEISNISRGLKQIAKELEVPVIALSQLNRQVEQRADNEPTLADLRESGSIEQDADLVIFLYKASRKSIEENPILENYMLVKIAKHRNGDLGEFTFYFNKPVQRIEERGDGNNKNMF
jgi:replicative DNA helicase